MFDEIRQLSTDLILARHKNYERYFIRTKHPKHRFNIILGERGVGKTTTLVQYLLQHSKGDMHSDKILYVQSDHFVTQQTTLYEIAQHYSQLGVEMIGFDEIHKYPDWSMELKSIYDTFPDLRIYASGSSALEIHRGSHDLSRRALLHKMYGLSFREYIELKYQLALDSLSLEDIFKNHTKLSADICKKLKKKKILALFKEYLISGYYPYFLDTEELSELLILIEQNVHATIESDLVATHPALTGNTINKIKQLMSYIASTVPFTPNWKKIKDVIGVRDDRTLKDYFKYLQDSMLIFHLTQSTKKFKKIEVDEKILLSNASLLHALNYDGVNIGTVRETFLISQLHVHHNISAPLKGDLLIDDKYTIEIGGRKKSTEQIHGIQHSYIAADDIEIGAQNKIPLWLFGFLY